MSIESPNTKRQLFKDRAFSRVVAGSLELPVMPDKSNSVRRFMNERQVVSTSSSPMPGFTFHFPGGQRVQVSDEPEYNRHGNGVDDLWYIEFDSMGIGSLYDEQGRFQALISVAQCAGYIRGTLLGLGADPEQWENVAQGTYWVGCNGVLYSANEDEPRYRLAVN